MSSDGKEHVFEKSRIEALTDGIFAVSMTLLVLELKLPDHPPLGGPPVEWEKVLEFLEPRASSYVVSFFVLCVFWMGHVRLMRLVQHVDHRFLWLSLVFILATTFVPFSTSLLSTHYRLQTVAIIYGANIALILLTQFLLWRDVLGKPHLRTDEVSSNLAKVVLMRYSLTHGEVVLEVAQAIAHPRASTMAFVLLFLMGVFRPKPPQSWRG
jgi:uncharacterized membrane protein